MWLALLAPGTAASDAAGGFIREAPGLERPVNAAPAPYRWESQLPADVPVERSPFIRGLQFTGRYANYTGADTWYFAWAADGHQYSTWTDGFVFATRTVDPFICQYCTPVLQTLGRGTGQAGQGSPYHCHSNVEPPCLGLAKITGDSPLDLRVEPLGRLYAGHNLYPCVSIAARGAYYVGSYNAFENGGPFHGFCYAKDWDRWVEQLEPGWRDSHWYNSTTAQGFFPDDGQPRRFQAVHAVSYRQENRLSPDGKLYFTSHGQLPGGLSDWDKGDAVYLCRVAPEPQFVVDRAAYEFYAGRDPHGAPVWQRDVRSAEPILAWPGRLGSESITYLPRLRRHLLVTARLAERESPERTNTLAFWESRDVAGPYRLVAYLQDWGPQAYFPHVPPKFVGDDGRTLWLCVSCNYSSGEANPPQCRYAASLHEIELDVIAPALETAP